MLCNARQVDPVPRAPRAPTEERADAMQSPSPEAGRCANGPKPKCITIQEVTNLLRTMELPTPPLLDEHHPALFLNMYFVPLHSLFDQPPIPCALSLLQHVLVLGFTTKSSPLRMLGIAPMLSFLYLALRASEAHRDTTHQLFLIMSMGSTASIVFQYIDSALLSRWTYSARGPTSALGGQKNLQKNESHIPPGALTSKLVFGWEEAFRARSASSPWEVPNVPKFYPADKRPDRLPTKAQFLRYAALRCLASFCVVDMIGWMGRDTSMNAVHFASERIPLFARWQDSTGEELILRLVCSVLHWLVAFCVLQGLYYGAAIVVVGILGWGRIERWPPLFNRMTHCWSVRRFWG